MTPDEVTVELIEGARQMARFFTDESPLIPVVVIGITKKDQRVAVIGGKFFMFLLGSNENFQNHFQPAIEGAVRELVHQAHGTDGLEDMLR